MGSLEEFKNLRNVIVEKYLRILLCKYIQCHVATVDGLIAMNDGFRMSSTLNWLTDGAWLQVMWCDWLAMWWLDILDGWEKQMDAKKRTNVTSPEPLQHSEPQKSHLADADARRRARRRQKRRGKGPTRSSQWLSWGIFSVAAEALVKRCVCLRGVHILRIATGGATHTVQARRAWFRRADAATIRPFSAILPNSQEHQVRQESPQRSSSDPHGSPSCRTLSGIISAAGLSKVNSIGPARNPPRRRLANY